MPESHKLKGEKPMTQIDLRDLSVEEKAQLFNHLEELNELSKFLAKFKNFKNVNSIFEKLPVKNGKAYFYSNLGSTLNLVPAKEHFKTFFNSKGIIPEVGKVYKIQSYSASGLLWYGLVQNTEPYLNGAYAYLASSENLKGVFYGGIDGNILEEITDPEVLIRFGLPSEDSVKTDEKTDELVAEIQRLKDLNARLIVERDEVARKRIEDLKFTSSLIEYVENTKTFNGSVEIDGTTIQTRKTLIGKLI